MTQLSVAGSGAAGPNPWRWVLHIFTVLYFTMSFVVRFAWPPVIPLAAPELGISMAQAGAYMSAFFMGYIVTQIPGGMLGDRFGARFVLCAALMLEGLGTFAVGLAPDYATGFGFRVLTGLGGGMVFASCVRYISMMFPPKELGLAFGLLLMAPSGVGVVVPNMLMPWLQDMFGWRGAFQVISGLGFGMGLVALLLVRDTPRRSGGTGSVRRLLQVLRQRNLILLGCAGFWLTWCTVGFITWGNTHVKAMGFSLVEASHVMLAYGVGGIIGSPLGGLLAPRVRSLKYSLMMLFVCMAPATWVFSQSSSLGALVVAAGCTGMVVGLANPFTPMLTTMYASRESMGTAGGVTSCIYQFGAMTGPWVIGKSVDLSGGFTLAWAILIAAPLMGALCLVPLREKNDGQEP